MTSVEHPSKRTVMCHLQEELRNLLSDSHLAQLLNIHRVQGSINTIACIGFYDGGHVTGTLSLSCTKVPPRKGAEMHPKKDTVLRIILFKLFQKSFKMQHVTGQ